MRTQYLRTKIRPFKRMFVVEPTDFSSFMELFAAIQKDIDAIFNLIFVNDDDLWSEATNEFVKRSDPDIILNFSMIDNDRLSKHFSIDSVNPKNDSYKTERYGTDLFSFSKRPPIFEILNVKHDFQFQVFAGKEITDKSLSLLTAINFGVFPKGLKSRLGLSIFKKIKVNYITTLQNVLESIDHDNDKFIRLTTELGGFGGSGYGSSIYYIGYNHEHYFAGKNDYYFVSDFKDLTAICYFWNTRSYYQGSKLRWVPIDYIEELKPVIKKDTVFVSLSDTITANIRLLYPENKIVKPSHLHFDGPVNRWVFFEHEQTVTITDNKLNVHHPAAKSFSGGSSMGAYVLEISNLKETIFPKHRNAGDLFFPENYDNWITQERFLRLSEHGLARYVFELSMLQSQDIVESIRLPSFEKLIKHVFSDQGFDVKKSNKTSIIDQAINLLGGTDQLGFLANRPIFDLIVAMTPQLRSEKVAHQIAKEASEAALSTDNVMDLIAEIREKGALNFPAVTLTVEEMCQKAKPLRPATLYPVLQHLNDKNILLRGKYFECEHCGSKLWLPIAEISRDNFCPDCNNAVNIPVFRNDKQESDHYRLNQLFIRAVDQGQLSTLLPLNLLVEQKYNAFEFIANLEVFEGRKLYTDIDLLVKLWKRLGFIECKTLQLFTEKQVKEVISIATKMKCDFIGFSSLHLKDSEALAELYKLLQNAELKIPAFIITGEALFAPKERMLQRHFETLHRDQFQTGPIFI
jgi:hypothetical protein